MLQEYNAGVIELCGEDYPAEVGFEIYEGRAIVHAVRIVKRRAGPDEIYWDPTGRGHVGSYTERLDITRFLSTSQLRGWEEEIETYLEWLYAENQAA